MICKLILKLNYDMSRFVVAIFSIILFSCCFFSETILQANDKPSNFLKISYIQSPASKPRLLVIKQQLKNDPKRYEQLRDKMLSSKVYHSVYIDLSKGEMVAIQDSFKVYPSISVPSVIEGAYKLPNENTEVVEYFLGIKRYYSIPKVSVSLDFDSSCEAHKILGYNVVRAKMNGDPDRYADIWITMDINLVKRISKKKDYSHLYSCAPGYYMGLAGIVLEAQNLFGSFKASKVEYLSSREEIDMAIKKIKIKKKKAIVQNYHQVQKSYRVFASKILHMLDALKYDGRNISNEDL